MSKVLFFILILLNGVLAPNVFAGCPEKLELQHPFELKTSRLNLKLLSLEDSQQVFDIFNNPEIAKTNGKPGGIENTRAYLISNGKIVEGVLRAHFGLMLGEKMIGVLTMRSNFPHLEEASIGYVVLPEFQQQGFATDALLEAMRFLTEDKKLPFTKLKATVEKENSISIHMLENHGFQKTGESDPYFVFEKTL